MSNRRIQWHSAGKSAVIQEVMHVSIVIPVVVWPFMPDGWWVVVALWAGCYRLLVHKRLTLKAALNRARLWLGGNIRTSKNMRDYQNMKRGR